MSPITKPSRRAAADRRGFTLVELLVVVTVIGIMAGATLGGLHSARQAARAAKTRSLITKLDSVIMQRYESYLTRRVPISTRGMNPEAAARRRLEALRDLIRLEMPERWNDVTDPPIPFSDSREPNTIALPGLARLYQGIYMEAYNRAGEELVGENSAAECLYLIVTVGDPEARELFSQNEIGDVDGDGLFEFLDGWGNPIRFLRWAPGYSSDFGADSGRQSGDPVADHDPFDSRNLEPHAFKLVPLIFSYGPDGEPGIEIAKDHHFIRENGSDNIYDQTNENFYIGQPKGTGHHVDNIHNHVIEGR